MVTAGHVPDLFPRRSPKKGPSKGPKIMLQGLLLTQTELFLLLKGDHLVSEKIEKVSCPPHTTLSFGIPEPTIRSAKYSPGYALPPRHSNRSWDTDGVTIFFQACHVSLEGSGGIM